LVVGGYDGHLRVNSAEILSVESSLANKNLSRLPVGLNWRPMLFLNGDHLLICGGSNGASFKKCLKYEKDSWKEHSTLNSGRLYSSAITANGTFIFGGDFDNKFTFTYLPKNSKDWQEGRTKIPEGFKYGCVVEVPGKQEILLIGGLETQTRILKFDIETQAFEEMNVSLLDGRWYHACAKIPDTNLLMITHARGTEIFNLEDNTIVQGNSMNTKRYDHGMAVVTINNQDHLAVFGGFFGKDFLDSVEILNPRTRKWELSDMKLNSPRRGFAQISLPNDFFEFCL